ncbi:MAG TPA: SAM-dependent methyltransferase [Opitutus sp.]|nr:SAM-dependent methyltransferase [Opitutus sp.]
MDAAPPSSARDRFVALLRATVDDGTLEKLTLGKPRAPADDPTLRNLFVRPVALKSGPHLSFLWRHTTRDVTKNLPADAAFAEIDSLLGPTFLDAHLFTATQSAQLETQANGSARLRVKSRSGERQRAASSSALVTSPAASHDRSKHHLISADAPWLRALGVTNDRGRPREGMADKFRQIQKFAELLTHLLAEALPTDRRSAVGDQPSDSSPQLPTLNSQLPAPLRILDAGSGKGYLTFALAALLGDRAAITGIEARPELVDLCNRLARENHFTNLTFQSGQISESQIVTRNSEIVNHLDVLIALHACDAATDDALARGIAAGARLLVVAPCCQKELRPQLTAPPVLADALRHGIFQERTAEFVTDALRAQILEWTGYRTKAFEFISTEHTAKNLMLAAIKSHAPGDPGRAARIRAFAAFYGIRSQSLARQLGFDLVPN